MHSGLMHILIMPTMFLTLAQAQVQLSGTVSWKGKPVAGARIQLIEPGLESLTDSQGHYSLAGPSALREIAGKRRRAAVPPTSGPMVLFGTQATGWRDPMGRTPQAFDWGAFFQNRPAQGAIPMVPQDPALVKLAALELPAYKLSVSARGYRDTAMSVTETQAKADIGLEKDLRRHLWIWGNESPTSAAGRTALFEFADHKGIGTLYVDAGGLMGGNKAALRTLLKAAHDRGFAVELLFGAPEWALAANHATPVNLARETVALLQFLKADGEAYPTSIQMDVEPYSLPLWDTDKATVANDLIDMYIKLKEALKGTPVGVTACVPRWFDNHPIARQGRTRLLSDWIADVADRMTLMDYVDHAKGIMDGAEHEMAYADSIGKEVVIGVETIAGLEPESVTFAEEGEAALEAALAETVQRFGSNSSYFGIAVHHYASYPLLKP